MELPTPETHIEYKPIIDDEGNVVLKKKSEIKKGKKSKALGLQFESRVRKDLEEKGWIVDKWSNNVDMASKRIVGVKRHFLPFRKGPHGLKDNPFIGGISTIGTGFPDFIGMQRATEDTYRIIGIEVKINGQLSREEKEKCRWYLDNKVFSQILVAKKVKRGKYVVVEYTDIKEILERMR